jgi:hypothetical protein
MATKCRLPTFNFAFVLPSFSIKLPSLPVISFSLSLYCPLD